MGDKWWETGHTRKPQAREGHTTKFKKLNPRAIGQRAARDIYDQHVINTITVVIQIVAPHWMET